MAESKVRTWVRDYLARFARIGATEISFDRTLADYGLDSVDAVLMAGELEEAEGVEIDPATFIQFDSIEQMILALEKSLPAQEQIAGS
jgi:phthiocerol/phenolphthiocerol synthesis type-I polyketide synthase B